MGLMLLGWASIETPSVIPTPETHANSSFRMERQVSYVRRSKSAGGAAMHTPFIRPEISNVPPGLVSDLTSNCADTNRDFKKAFDRSY